MKNTNRGLVFLLISVIAMLGIIAVIDLITFVKYGGGNSLTDCVTAFVLIIIVTIELVIKVRKKK